MKTVALAALLVATGFAAPASAQYYGPRGGYDGPPGGGYGGGGYDRPRGGGYGYDGPRGGYDDGRRGPPQRRGSTVCVTSRGSCPIGGVVPRNAPCGCEIPGFGYKRGAAG